MQLNLKKGNFWHQLILWVWQYITCRYDNRINIHGTLGINMEGGEGETQSPLLSHLVLLRLEEAIDKLKILGYEKDFCQRLRFRPIPRSVFFEINFFTHSLPLDITLL